MFDEKNEIRWYFSLENGFLLLTNLSLSRKSGPQQQQKKNEEKKNSRETSEKCAFFAMENGIIYMKYLTK